MVNVVFHTAFIGDLLLTIPLLKKMKSLYPNQNLFLVTKPGLSQFFMKLGIVDDCFEVDKTSRQSVFETQEKLNSFEIENLICPHKSFHSALMISKVRAKRKISFRQWWNAPFFHDRVNRYKIFPEALRNLALLAPISESVKGEIDTYLGNSDYHNPDLMDSVVPSWVSVPNSDQWRLVPDSKQTQDLLDRLSIKKPYVCIAPSSQWPTKRWTTKGFSELMRLLSERGLHIYLVGTPQESQDCNAILANLEHPQSDFEMRSLAGDTSLNELHQLFSQAEAIVSNDSGPMHMGVLSGRPVVGIFGPTTLKLGFGPWAPNASVIQANLSCRPCGKHGHLRCPLGTHDCMKNVSANEVASAVDHWLQN